jgi:hypothetical protein
MSNLRSALDQIANQFVDGVLAAMRSASLGELAGHSGPTASSNGSLDGARPTRSRKTGAAASSAEPRTTKAGRKKRASAEEVQQQKATALTAAKQLKPGFSKGDVMKKSRSTVNLGRALALLVVEGKLTKKGDRRNMRYWLK